MNRRRYLALLGAGSLATLAGCIGDDDDDPDDDPDNPEEVLPDTDEWPLEDTNDQLAQLIGAEDGVQGVWDFDDGESQYEMEVFLFDNPDEAAQAAEEVPPEETWDISLAVGVWAIWAQGGDEGRVDDLVLASPVVEEDDIDYGDDEPTDMDGGPENGDDRADEDNSDGDGQTDNEHDIEIVAGDHEMEIVDATLGSRPHTVVPIENLGNVRSGEITLRVEYFDRDDRFAGESSTQVATLRPGETWIAEDIGRNIDGEEIQYSEIDLSVTEEPPEEHQEIEFFDTVYCNGDGFGGGRITGGVTNTGEEAIDFAIIARLFDSEGRVTGDWVFSKGEIDPQEERNMEIHVVGNMRYERAGEDPEFELIPIETGFYF